ncbi:hypothetical protein TNCT_655201 [Trichonephila clavata]|uniref:Uncharacterized protein n=1 Tax=Trichonephila clavata TaxID=2740835 RepID=A0A8X6IBD7_TRICU|nr:hypothetical protein TNCT_655201 [Trichonephila clavata]
MTIINNYEPRRCSQHLGTRCREPVPKHRTVSFLSYLKAFYANSNDIIRTVYNLRLEVILTDPVWLQGRYRRLFKSCPSGMLEKMKISRVSIS